METTGTKITTGDADQQTGIKQNVDDAGQQQTGNNGIAADSQQEANQDAAGNQNDEVTGLKAAAEAERKKRQEAEEQAAYAQRQLELNQQQAVVSANQPKTSAEQALADLGITADDLYGENQLRFIERKDQIDKAQTQQQQAMFSVHQFITQHPDINEVVGSVNPATGLITAPSSELSALVAKKRYLTGATLEMLYESVVQERKLLEFEKSQTVLKEHQKRQGVDNDTLPLGASAAGGVAGGDVQQKLMSRDEVLETERKLTAGEL